MQYLKIENVGVCPPEGFTIFGATSKEDSSNPQIIGTFGSGAKHGVSLALRQGLLPVVYCGKLRLAFYTKPLKVKGVAGEKSHQQLCVKISGSSEDGRSVNQDKELDHTLSYGNKDWGELALALREFVSNALDACAEQGISNSNMSVELVDENQVRAKAGTTRIFVPANMDVMKFYNEIDKWFLHFKEKDSLDKKILFKNDRNTPDKFGVVTNNAVIFRRGVRVREFVSGNAPSLFDYNIPDLPIDEARTIDDWKARFECAQALVNTTDVNAICAIFQKLQNHETCWELEQDSFALNYSMHSIKEDKRSLWKDSFVAVFGPKAVLTIEALADRILEKGYVPVVLNNNQTGMLKFLKEIGIQSDSNVLTINDLNNRKVYPATAAVRKTFEWVWSKLSDLDMTYGRATPQVHCFKQMSEASTITMGYWLDDQIYINHDISEAITDSLRDTMIEEIAHHITRATDGSRDFANFLIRFSCELAKVSQTNLFEVA